MGPYLNMTPRNWRFLLMGPHPPSRLSPVAAEEDLLAILTLAERPRTMLENQEVVVDDDDGDAVDVERDVEERFIS